MVIAESRYLAEDAAELVSVEIEPDTPVVTMAQALAEGGPRVHPERPDNLAGVVPAADSPQLDAIIENAPHVFTETFDQHRYVDVPMETRGLVAEWDQQVGQLEVIFAGQGVHVPRSFFARMLNLPEDEIRVVMGDVGGSFGQKAFPAAGGPGRRGSRGDPREPAGEVDRGPGREPDLRRARPGGVAGDHRGHRRERRAAGGQGPPSGERGRLPGGEQRADGGVVRPDVPRALPLVRARLGGLLRPGRLHQHRAGTAPTAGRG